MNELTWIHQRRVRSAVDKVHVWAMYDARGVCFLVFSRLFLVVVACPKSIQTLSIARKTNKCLTYFYFRVANSLRWTSIVCLSFDLLRLWPGDMQCAGSNGLRCSRFSAMFGRHYCFGKGKNLLVSWSDFIVCRFGVKFLCVFLQVYFLSRSSVVSVNVCCVV